MVSASAQRAPRPPRAPSDSSIAESDGSRLGLQGGVRRFQAGPPGRSPTVPGWASRASGLLSLRYWPLGLQRLPQAPPTLAGSSGDPISAADFRPLPLSWPLALPAVDSLLSPGGGADSGEPRRDCPALTPQTSLPSTERRRHLPTVSQQVRKPGSGSRPPCSGPETRRPQSLRLGLTVATWRHRVGWSVTGWRPTSRGPWKPSCPGLRTRPGSLAVVWGLGSAWGLWSGLRAPEQRQAKGRGTGGPEGQALPDLPVAARVLVFAQQASSGPRALALPASLPCLLHFPPQAGLAQLSRSPEKSAPSSAWLATPQR